ncbi:MAG: dipeptidase [Sedimentisphaerales bacterium]|nr:dipeptidase [Sedimentisphaerales bacterium]
MPGKSVSVILLVCLSFFLMSPNLYARHEPIEAKAAKIHAEVLTIDTHVDTPMKLLRPNFDFGQHHDPRTTGSKVDLPRMEEGGLDAVFFAVYIPQGPRTPQGNQRAKEQAIQRFDAINQTIDAHSTHLELARTPEDAYSIEKSGKRAIYIGIENGYAMGNDISLIQHYYDLGARYITLSHIKNNDICDSSTDTPEHRGLSAFGKKVVAEMNRLGMLVDVSHISDEAFDDVMEITKAPVIASHSCARVLCDHPRNLNDEKLVKLAENGGVIQVCVVSSYVKKTAPNPEWETAVKALKQKYMNPKELSKKEQKNAQEEQKALDKKYPRQFATVSDVVDHIDHIVRVAGMDHVGIGTDLDGGAGLNGCYDVSELGNITLELVRRGYTKEQIRKIWAGNFMRVFRKAIEVAEALQSAPRRNPS